MDILEILKFKRLRGVPKPPADTLAVVAKQLNGEAEIPEHVAHALGRIDAAIPEWTSYIKAIGDYGKQIAALGADDAQHGKLQDALARAQNELGALQDGRPGMDARLAKVRRDGRAKAMAEAKAAVAADLEAFAGELLQPCMKRATELLASVEAIGDPATTTDVAVLLSFFANFVADRSAVFTAGIATLARKPVSLAVTARTAQVSKPAPRPVPHQGLGHAINLAIGPPLTPEEVGRLHAKRQPDDLSPLEPGEARVEVLSAGYSPAEDKPQSHYGHKTKMAAGTARRAQDAGKVKILEVNLDVPEVGYQVISRIAPQTQASELLTIGAGPTITERKS